MTVKLSKQDVVDRIAESEGESKALVNRIIDNLWSVITDTLQKRGSVTFVGVGTFTVSDRQARVGRNPQTGEPIQIAAATVPKFKAGKGLKEAVNQAARQDES